VSFQTLLGRVARATDLIAGLLVVAMMLHITADVAGRYLFNRPVPLTIEIVSYYYMVAIVFLPLAATELLDKHIYVEMLFERLSAPVRRRLLRVVHGISAVAFIVVTVQTWIAAVHSFQVGQYTMGAYAIIIWPSRFVVPIGCGLMVIVLLAKTFGPAQESSGLNELSMGDVSV